MMLRFIAAILGVLASATYWWLATTIAYVLTAGDVAPGAAPPFKGAGDATLIAVAVIAVLLYAVLTLAWRRVEDRFIGRRPADVSE